MAALDFPAAPAVNDTYSANGRTFTWNGESWLAEGNRPLTATVALDFPAAPDPGEQYEENGRTWEWNGESWRSLGSVGVVFDAWEEITRSNTVSGGAITISGLTLTDYVAVRFVIAGVTTGTNDNTLQCQFSVGGSLLTGASDYIWSQYVGASFAGGFREARADNDGDTAISLGREGAAANSNLGNASTEGMWATVTVFDPAGSAHKLVQTDEHYAPASATAGISILQTAKIATTSAIDGFKIFGSADLATGTVIVLGLT